MIKAIITDVDGVIVGTKQGVNFPLPTDRVIEKLKELHKNGIPVILCTGKSSFAIEDIILKAGLDNPHITDAGAFIYNPLRKQVVKEHAINKQLVHDIVKTCLEHNIYLEVHKPTEYFIQNDQVQSLTSIRTNVLLKEYTGVKSLMEVIDKSDVIKILAFINDKSEKQRLADILAPFDDHISAIWSTVPFMLPAEARVITAKNISKMHAAQEVMDYLGLSFDECLGIGDLPPDWKFIKLCKYAAGLGNLDEEFKAQIMSKGEGNYFIAKSVDEDGFLDIVTKFLHNFH